MSIVLQLCYGRQFLKYFIFSLIGLALIVILFDMLELFRRSVNKPHIGIYDILQLSFYKLWSSIYLVFPFAIFLATSIFFFLKLHSNEFIALKSIGTSSVQILLAPFICVIIIGLFNMMVVNHIGAQLFKEFETLENNLFRQKPNQLAISKNGLWLREENENRRRTLIYAEEASNSGQNLQKVQVFLLTDSNSFLQRISAESAVLYGGYWQLNDASFLDGTGEVRKSAIFLLETSLTSNKIESGVSGPNSLSLWELPRFISELQASGFSALSYRLHMQRLLAEPIMFLSVLILSAGLLFNIKRREYKKQIVQASFLSTLLVVSLVVMNHLIYAWGLNGNLPIFVATWVPPIIGLCFASGILLRLEEV